MHPRVSAHLTIVLAFIYRESVAEKVREGPTLPVGAKNDAEKFGPLKTVLRDIPALYDNREVCLQPSTQILH